MFELADAALFLRLELLLEGDDAILCHVDALLGLALVLRLLALLAQVVNLLLKNGFLLLQHLVNLFTFGLECLDLMESIFVWHQRVDRYKFFEFHILHEVLGELVDVELIEVGQEDIL